MNNRYLKLQDILSDGSQSEDDIKTYALGKLRKEIDYQNQTELLTKLVLDHSSITKRLEKAHKELVQHREMLENTIISWRRWWRKRLRKFPSSQMATIYALIKGCQSQG